MTGCMSTPLYVHVTHTQHTHTRTHNTRCMRTPGGTTCWHLHSTGPRLCVRFVMKGALVHVVRLWLFMDQFVLSDLSHLPGTAYCVYQIHYVCDVRNSLLLSGRGGKTSQRQATQHHVSLRVVRGLFIPVLSVLFWSTTLVWTNLRIRDGFGGLWHARDVVFAWTSMTCVARALYVLVYFVLYFCVDVYIDVSVCTLWSGLLPFSVLIYDLLPRQSLDGFR